jgi:hypothetical protein
MDVFYARKQKNNTHIVKGELDGMCGQRVSTGRFSSTSAVEPGHGLLWDKLMT